jgi:hypothetical protein
VSRILPLPFHVFDELNTLRARTSSAENALHVVALFGDGAHIVLYPQNKPTVRLWTKGKEASMSLAAACDLVLTRRAAAGGSS